MNDLIQAERERLTAIMEATPPGSKAAQAHAAAVALAWVLEPDRFDPPSGYIRRIPEGSPDCLEECRLGESQDTTGLKLDAA